MTAEPVSIDQPVEEEEAVNSTGQFGQELREAVAKILGVDVKDVMPRRQG